jgi:hypothetical protein
VFFRRRRNVQARIGTIALVLATYLLSSAPATASVIYCITDAGHSGFELVASGERGCASCCHDEVDRGNHEGFAAADECTDVFLALAQDLRRASPGVAAPALLPFVHAQTWARPSRQPAPSRAPDQTALAPPRSAPSALIAFTVLTI